MSIKKNTCWFFGDSFTRGDNCHVGDEYYEYSYTDGCKRWSTIVSEKLSMEEKNTAYGGDSNMGILSILLDNIKDIKSGDYVILGDTRPVRVSSFNSDGNRINTINDPHYDYTRGNSKYILDYIYHEILPHEDAYLDHYQKMFISILDELSNRGVITLHWKHTDFWYPDHNRFNTIYKDTKGKVSDLHWSWSGHRKMADTVLGILGNGGSLI